MHKGNAFPLWLERIEAPCPVGMCRLKPFEGLVLDLVLGAFGGWLAWERVA